MIHLIPRSSDIYLSVEEALGKAIETMHKIFSCPEADKVASIPLNRLVDRVAFEKFGFLGHVLKYLCRFIARKLIDTRHVKPLGQAVSKGVVSTVGDLYTVYVAKIHQQWGRDSWILDLAVRDEDSPIS